MIYYYGPSLVAIATGIAGSAWVSGSIACFSIVGVPTANAIPETSARTWAELYYRGAATMPKFAATVAISYLYAAYDTHKLGGNWKGFAAAAVSVMSIVPFTIFFMASTNRLLLKAANEAGVLTKEQISGLLGSWGSLNLARSFLPLVGTVLGAWTFFSNALL